MFMSWWLTRSPLVATLEQAFCLRSTLESTKLPAEGGEEGEREERRGEREGGKEEGKEGGKEGREEIEHDNQYKMS